MSCGCGPQKCANFDDDREGVSDADLARFGGDDIACPNCGADLYHDAAMCHTCGYAITDASLRKGMPKWVPIAAALVLAGMLLTIFVWAI